MDEPAEELLLTCRQDAAEPEIQDALEEAAKRRRPFICGYCRGKNLSIFSVLDHLERGFIPRCGRDELERHDIGCFMRTGGRLFDPPPNRRALYGPGIFLPAELGPGRGERDAPPRDSSGEEQWYVDLTHLFNATWMRAILAAFAESNRGLHYASRLLAGPSKAHVFDRMLDNVNRPMISDGSSPAAAARRAGLQLHWGITHQPLAQLLIDCRTRPAPMCLELAECWDAFGPKSSFATFDVSPAVALAAGGRTHAYANVISGPFFVGFSAMGSCVARMMIMPVALIGDEIHSVDSGLERKFFPLAHGAGAVLIKPCVRAEMGMLSANLWPFPFEKHGPLPHLPDAIAYAGSRVHLLEIEGSPRVSELVDRRLEEYRTWAGPGIKVSVRKITAAQLSAPNAEFLKEFATPSSDTVPV